MRPAAGVISWLGRFHGQRFADTAQNFFAFSHRDLTEENEENEATKFFVSILTFCEKFFISGFSKIP